MKYTFVAIAALATTAFASPQTVYPTVAAVTTAPVPSITPIPVPANNTGLPTGMPTTITTFCPSPTTLTINGGTITVTVPTTLTFTVSPTIVPPPANVTSPGAGPTVPPMSGAAGPASIGSTLAAAAVLAAGALALL